MKATHFAKLSNYGKLFFYSRKIIFMIYLILHCSVFFYLLQLPFIFTIYAYIYHDLFGQLPHSTRQAIGIHEQ